MSGGDAPRAEAAWISGEAFDRDAGASEPGHLEPSRLSDRGHCDDVEQGLKPGEVGWVPRV